jgi:hypothetical protein
MGDENRNEQAQSLHEGFYVANHHQIIALYSVCRWLSVLFQTTWRSVYSAFFGSIFYFCYF